MVRTVAILSVLFAAGCAQTAAQQRMELLDAAWRTAEDACDRHYALRRSGILDRLLPDAKTRAQPTMEMLANKRKATELEKAAIRERADAYLKCAGEHRQVFSSFGTAQHVAIFDAYVNARYARFIDLYSGDLTYAEFLRTGTDAWNGLQSAIASLDEALRTDNAPAALQAQQNYVMLQQAPGGSFGPKQAACFRDGAYRTC